MDIWSNDTMMLMALISCLQAESEEEAASIKEAEEDRAEQRSNAAKERSKVRRMCTTMPCSRGVEWQYEGCSAKLKLFQPGTIERVNHFVLEAASRDCGALETRCV